MFRTFIRTFIRPTLTMTTSIKKKLDAFCGRFGCRVFVIRSYDKGFGRWFFFKFFFGENVPITMDEWNE